MQAPERARPLLAVLVLICLALPALLAAADPGGAKRTITFAGKQWYVKNGTGMGPGPNNWSDSEESVWVDTGGKLHLKIRQIEGAWYCAEVTCTEQALYGKYRFELETRVDLLDRNIVAAPFLYASDTEELDIEFSRWGDPEYDCGSYSVQPSGTSGNYHNFPVELEGDWTTHSITWQPSFVYFRSLHGHYEEPPSSNFVIADWLYTGANNPSESTDMRLHINFWLMSGLAPSNAQEAELVVSLADIDYGSFDPPLPVELSSFTVTASASNQALLTWVTQSETNLAGYAIYRGGTNDLAAATLLDAFIEAANSPQQQVYAYLDTDIYTSGTYYYWLESRELDGSGELFGPVSLSLEQQEPQPVPLPLVAGIDRLYPNPFNPSVDLAYTVTDPGFARISVLNLRGQKVRELLSAWQEPGRHSLAWDGRDAQGKPCASGVYQFILNSGNHSYSQKAVLQK